MVDCGRRCSMETNKLNNMKIYKIISVLSFIIIALGIYFDLTNKKELSELAFLLGFTIFNVNFAVGIYLSTKD